jgi:hypothetical protein
MSWDTGLARIGAAFYVLWGLVHYNAAYGVYQLAQSTPLTIEHGRLEQLAFYLASFATAGIALATNFDLVCGALLQYRSRGGVRSRSRIMEVCATAWRISPMPMTNALHQKAKRLLRQFSGHTGM